MKLTIDNRDTHNIHIDTYNMFTGDHTDDCMLENERETDPAVTYDSFEWKYNHNQIVSDLAHASIDTVKDAIQNTEYAHIIKDVTYIASGSPSFYNYTTDWYTMSVSIDVHALNKYIKANEKDITAIAEEYDDTILHGIISLENMRHASVCHILNNCISVDEYNMAMWEKEMDIYMENTTYTRIPDDTTNA